MIHKTTAFGSRKPPALWQSLISLCHDNNGGVVSRILAPLTRKLIISQKSHLPIDIQVEGINLRCQFTDNYSEKKFVFTPWRYDLQERELLANLLAQGGNFVDIGANVGLYTLTAAKAMTSAQGRILALEPNPPTLERLNDNLLFNDQITANRVTVLGIGVADKEGSFDLYLDRSNLGASSISERNRSKSVLKDKESVTIKCQPLLDVLDQESIGNIRALKIDIEGAEDTALIPFLNDCPESLLPYAIFIENSQHLWRSDLFGEIIGKGYSRRLHNRMNSVFVRDNELTQPDDRKI